MTLKIRILGCGSSGGVPRVGQGWGACDPADPRNRRFRCSILVEQRDDDRTTTTPQPVTRILVDTSPDLRQQLLETGVDRLDAILITHPHADHIAGMDDVRPLVIKARDRIAIHMDAETGAQIRERFAYIFETPAGSQYPPLLNEERLIPGRPTQVKGPGGTIDVLPIRLHHGDIDALGFRFGAIAYTPDLNGIPDESIEHLANLDLWIVDALRYTRHPSHFSLSETLEWLARMKPRRAILTNLHTDMDFQALTAQLPANVEPAYDGMEITA